MQQYSKQRLIELIQRDALQHGEFRLASGKTASFYLDCRKLTLSSDGANVVAAGMLEILEQNKPDAVGGMAIGADPITGAVITLAGIRGESLKGFIVRKESKTHGTGRDVEGPVEPGLSAVLVEDVVTTGGSSLLALEKVRAFGMTVDRIIAIVDRMAGAGDAFQRAGVTLHSLVTIEDLGITP